jgi:hypothetical protein
MPVNAATSTADNVPVYIIGTGISTNNYFPYYQGTATVSSGSSGNNYYGNNSTSSWNPAGASLIVLNDGDDNWYKILNVASLTANVSSSESLRHTLQMQVVSDVDATIQYGTGIAFSTSAYDTVNTLTMDSLNLTANLPKYISFNTSVTGSNTITGGSIYMRNITGSANVIVSYAALALSKRKL